MADNPKNGIGSKILRDRAMAVLRDTRSKIDPQFLLAMKEMFSGLTPKALNPETKEKPSFADMIKAEKGDEKGVKPAPAKYPIQSFDNVESPPEQSTSEPVDQQKIAKIVLEYMKNKQNGQRH